MTRTLRLPVTTHVLTGALNSGKTSLILHLLASKPKDEVWAILVNEMGALGVDQAVLASADGAVVRELSGGCLCCTLSVVTSAAIVQLLRKAKPDRFLIEPSGLAHPAALLALLQGPHLKPAVSLQPTVCLVDITRFIGTSEKSPERPIGPEIFNKEDAPTLLSQIDVADILLGTKADLCSTSHVAVFKQWAAQQHPLKRVLTCEHSQISLRELETLGDHDILDQERGNGSETTTQIAIVGTPRGPLARTSSTPWLTNAGDLIPSPALPRARMPVRMQNDDRSTREVTNCAVTCGWLFHQEDIFHRTRLIELSETLCATVLRLKALCRVGQDEWIHISSGGLTHTGGDIVTVSEAAKQTESRFELILPAVSGGDKEDGDGGAIGSTCTGQEENLLRRALLSQDWNCIEEQLIHALL